MYTRLLSCWFSITWKCCCLFHCGHVHLFFIFGFAYTVFWLSMNDLQLFCCSPSFISASQISQWLHNHQYFISIYIFNVIYIMQELTPVRQVHIFKMNITTNKWQKHFSQTGFEYICVKQLWRFRFNDFIVIYFWLIIKGTSQVSHLTYRIFLTGVWVLLLFIIWFRAILLWTVSHKDICKQYTLSP